MEGHDAAAATLIALASGAGFLFLFGALAARLRFSAIPLFIVAGMFTREFVPETHFLHPISTLGVLLLMFMVGLEFSPRDVVTRWRRVLRSGAIDAAINIPIGLLLGMAIGFPLQESILLAAIVYPTSTAIVSRALGETGRLANSETEHILNILLFEDLFIVVFLVLLGGAQRGTVGLASSWALLEAFGFCALILVTGFAGRRLLERLLDSHADEVFAIGLLAVLLFVCAAGTTMGLSEAVCALLAGMMVSETGLRTRAEQLVLPLQHALSGFFFLGFGLTLDWRMFPQVFPLAATLAIVTGVGKIAAGRLVGGIERLKPKASWRLAFSLVPRGEFSAVMASVAVATLGDSPASSRLAAGTGLYILLTVGGGLLLMMRGSKPAGPPAPRGGGAPDRRTRIVSLPPAGSFN